jgi:hypothetical protein
MATKQSRAACIKRWIASLGSQLCKFTNSLIESTRKDRFDARQQF